MTTDGSLSDPFTVDYTPVPVPVNTKDSASCTYVNNLSRCSTDTITFYWCVNFNESPEYKPQSDLPASDPDFIIRITGDDPGYGESCSNDGRCFTLYNEVEKSKDGDIYYYSHTLSKPFLPGYYSVTVKVKASFEGGDKYFSDPSDATTYTIYSKPNEPYAIPDGGVHYDRYPPVYKTNDVMKITWDDPDTGDAYPTPSLYYNWYIQGDPNFSCGTGASQHTTITLKSETSNVCSNARAATISLSPGEYILFVRTGMHSCGDRHDTYAPNFTVVDCLVDGDCEEGSYCDTNSLTYGTCVGL